MKKSILSAILILSSISSFAKVSSDEFIKCFEKAANEVITEFKATGSSDQKKRICDQLPQSYVDAITEKLSFIKNGELYFYSAESMGSEKMVDIYDYIKDDMNCYANALEGQSGSLLGAIVNSRAYNRNLDLTTATLNRMTGVDLWGSFFSSSKMYNTLDELDFSYCSK